MASLSFRNIRIRQIRLAAALMTKLGQRQAGAGLIARARNTPVIGGFLRVLLGFRGDFVSFAEAQKSASKAIPAGHEHPDDTRVHSGLADTIRESDYPILFHLAPIAAGLTRVFDLGGNVGNLFYAYQKHLSFSPSLRWTALDLPEKRAAGELLAVQRGETRLRYAASLSEASGADLLIISGALHYFEQPIDQLLAPLAKLPRRVVINRSPCAAGSDRITVQDAGSYLVPCKLYDRRHLIDAMAKLGYVLRDSWPVYERQLWLPLYPEASFYTYFGFYFDRAGNITPADRK